MKEKWQWQVKNWRRILNTFFPNVVHFEAKLWCKSCLTTAMELYSATSHIINAEHWWKSFNFFSCPRKSGKYVRTLKVKRKFVLFLDPPLAPMLHFWSWYQTLKSKHVWHNRTWLFLECNLALRKQKLRSM